MKRKPAMKKLEHQTIKREKHALLYPGEQPRAKHHVHISHDSFDRAAETYVSLLRLHLRARGFVFKPDHPHPDRKTEVAEDNACHALLELDCAKKALADGLPERAACHALMGGVLAKTALMLFYREQDSRHGRKERAEKQHAERAEITARAKTFWDKSNSPLSAKELHAELEKILPPGRLPPLNTFRAYLTRANWKKWPHPAREGAKFSR
jgi:hypothetical protein